MRVVKNALQDVLRRDPILQAILGLDADNDLKIYEAVAKQNTAPPFLLWQLVPSGDIAGHYGDEYALVSKPFQLTAWGRTANEAWQLWDYAQEAVETGDWDFELTPYKRMRLVSQADQQELPDVETSWVQVPGTFLLVVSR